MTVPWKPVEPQVPAGAIQIQERDGRVTLAFSGPLESIRISPIHAMALAQALRRKWTGAGYGRPPLLKE